MRRIVAHGTFDIIHYGHINYLEKAKSFGEYLIVLVTSDQLAKEFGKTPFFDENIRKKVILALKSVDEVIIRNEHINENFLKKLQTDVFVSTDEKYYSQNFSCQTIILDRTQNISTTKIKDYLLKK